MEIRSGAKESERAVEKDHDKDDDDKMTGTSPMKVITSLIYIRIKKNKNDDGYVAKATSKNATNNN